MQMLIKNAKLRDHEELVNILIDGGKIVEIGGNDRNYYYYQKGETTTALKNADGNLQDPTTGTSLVAFDDGKVFYRNDNGTTHTELYSDSDIEDFLVYRQRNSGRGDTDILFAGCEKKEMTKEEDGSWTLVLSGYSEDALEEIWEYFGMKSVAKLTDESSLTLTVKADKSYRVTSIAIHFLIEGKRRSTACDSVLNGEITFGSFNQAKRVENEYSDDDYQKTGNVLALLHMIDQISEWENADSGRFSLTSSMDSESSGNVGVTGTTVEEINFWNYDHSGYGFAVDSIATDGTKTELYYDSGELTVMKGNREVGTQSMTEDNARQIIQMVFASVSVDPAYVTGIDDLGDGVFEIHADEFARKQQQNSWLYDSYTYTIRVTIRDGKPVNIVSEMVLKLDMGYSITTRSELTPKES